MPGSIAALLWEDERGRGCPRIFTDWHRWMDEAEGGPRGCVKILSY